MDTSGLDGEEYIAAIRGGAIDPSGHTAAELEESLEAFDRGWSERLAALSAAELDEVIAGCMEVPPLPGPVESEHTRLQRLESEFVGRMRSLELRGARIEAEKRELLAARMTRVQEDGGLVDTQRREAASVLAAELHLSDRTVEQRMIGAWQLLRELPLTHEAHKAGRITNGHLRVIEQVTAVLRLDADVDADEKARVERALVALAETTTPGQLRSRAARIVDRALTAPLQQRHHAAKERRRAGLFDAGDGMSDLNLHVPTLYGAAAFDRATQAARNRPKDDPRTFEQYRADAMLELLLLGTTPDDLTGVSALTATVSVTIPATALLHDDAPAADAELRFPALLDGRILVDAETVRALAADAVTWERLFLHPVTGVPVTVDTYRLNRAMRRWLRARDGRCRWPGCNSPVSRADVDHTRDFALGGRTTLGNLAHLCRRHHTMKHATRWTVEQLQDGVLEWTSPLGEVIRNEPEPQGPRFVDTTVANAAWGVRDRGEPEQSNAPPVGAPF